MNTKRPTIVFFLGLTKPLPSYGSASPHRRVSKNREMTGRSQTLPWWLGPWGSRVRRRKKIDWPRWIQFFSTRCRGGGHLKKTTLASNWQIFAVHHKEHIYLDYRSVCPLVRIGTPTPYPPSECVPPRNQRGEGTHYIACRGGDGGLPIWTTAL